MLRSFSLGMLAEPSNGWCVAAPGRPPAYTADLFAKAGVPLPADQVLLERTDGRMVVILAPGSPTWTEAEKELAPWSVDTTSGPLQFRVTRDLPMADGYGTFWRAAAPGVTAGFQGSVWALGLEPEASPPAAIAGAMTGVRRMPEPERREWLDRARSKAPPDAQGEGWTLRDGVLGNPACGVSWTLSKGEIWRVDGAGCGVVLGPMNSIRMEVTAVDDARSAEQIAQEAVGAYVGEKTKTELRRCMVGDALGWEAWIHTEEVAERRLCTVRKGARAWTVKSDYPATDSVLKGLVADNPLAGLMLSE